MTESPLKDGLLLLLQAAQKIDRESSKSTCHHSERWDARTGSSRHFYEDGPAYFSSHYSSSIHRRSAPSTRCTHNELEKSRRAHLRTCMDALKELLVFDDEAPRITTLTVLRKATSTIQQLQQRNEYLEACEDGEKQRFSQLMKRRQALRKKIESKRNRTLKIQNWRERNRNYSECSVLTTSSEDSEMSYGSRHIPSNMYSILPISHQQQQQLSANDNHCYASPYETTAGVVAATLNSSATTATATVSTTILDSVTTVTAPATAISAAVMTYAASQTHHNLSYQQKVESHSSQPSGGAHGMSPTDAYDASSSDSGFEEVITATNAVDEQQTLKMVQPVVSNTEEVVYTAYQSSDCFKTY
ncbi:Mxi neural development protein [Echinococcus multilocularis]|uniref:Mxi neural development protein n=1 Tax=Echinococcus multilocularis TaxID=6211 RepID=A0A068YB28_ECHMU|nr:Mxi neural development protein [Echinococcus multilocularis]